MLLYQNYKRLGNPAMDVVSIPSAKSKKTNATSLRIQPSLIRSRYYMRKAKIDVVCLHVSHVVVGVNWNLRQVTPDKVIALLPVTYIPGINRRATAFAQTVNAREKGKRSEPWELGYITWFDWLLSIYLSIKKLCTLFCMTYTRLLSFYQCSTLPSQLHISLVNYNAR